MKPLMSDAELAVYSKYLSGAKKYLEYGCGGSTYMAASRTPSLEQIVSVEGAGGWIEKLKKEAPIRDAVASGRLTFHHIDYNADEGGWSAPKDMSKHHLFPQYSDVVKSYPANTFDMVLVDGRFRVACIAKLYDHVSESTKIIVHDFMNRPQYHCVLAFFEIVEKVDTLVCLKKKEKVDRDLLTQICTTYQYQWA